MEKQLWVKLLIAKSPSLSELTLLWCMVPLPCPQPQMLLVYNLLQTVHASPLIYPLLPFKQPTQFVNNCSQSFSYLSQECFNGRATTLYATYNIHVTECNTQNLFSAEQVQNELLKLFIPKAFIKINLKWFPAISSDMPKSVRIRLWALTSGRLCMLPNWFSTTPATVNCKVGSETEIYVRPMER